MVRTRGIHRYGTGGAASLTILLMLALNAVSGLGAVTCRVDLSPRQVNPGDVATLTATVEGEFGWSADFRLPDLKGVSAAEGGSNQSVSMVNGMTRASVSRTWYLTVTGDKDVVVGPITIQAGKETCRTEPVTLVVSPGRTGGALPPTVTGNRQARPRSEASPRAGSRAGGAGDDIFVTLEADRDEAWVGQQVILTFGYWRRVRPWNNPTFTPPRTEGFWREDLGTERNFNRIAAGRTYSVTEVRYALFPTRSGDLVVEPAELHFPADVFDSFFGSSRRRGPRTLRTDSLVIRVRELPSPRPAGFSGLVASELQLQASVSPDSVGTGDALTLKAGLTADAFLKGFEGLTVTPPAGAQMHDADTGFQAQDIRGRLSGHVTLEKILVPRTPGPLVIPPLELVWFDTESGSYRTAKAPLQTVTVSGNDMGVPAPDSGFLREGLQRRTRDLAFIHPVPRRLRKVGDGLVGGGVWWMVLLLPVLLLVAARLVLDRMVAAGRDIAGRRRRGALRNARLLLQEAEALAGGDSCAKVARAICGFAEDMTGSPTGTGDAGMVRRLGGGQADDAVAEIVAILEHCDHVRFGGVDPKSAASLSGRVLAGLTVLSGNGDRNSHGAPDRVLGVFLVLLLLGGLGSAPHVVAADDQPEQWVAEGNQAYTSGDLDTAVDRYRQALAAGVDDAVLHFNLGNAETRRGHLGAAIASYLRARRLDPSDGDIRANLAFVRSFTRDLELTGQEQPLFLAQLAQLADTMNIEGWGWVLVVMVWALMIFLGRVMWIGSWTESLRRWALALGALVCIVAGMTGWRWYLDRGRDLGVITTAEVEVRSGPDTDFPTLFAVHDGLTVNLEGSSGDWLRIGLGGDWTGWVPAGDLERVDQDQLLSGR